MTPLDHSEYFQLAAMRNKMVAHMPDDPNNTRFFEWSIEELDSNLNGRFSGLSIILEHYNTQEEDQLSNNPYFNSNIGFWVLAPVSDPNDFRRQSELKTDCWKVAVQFWQKIRNDYLKGIYKGYQPGTFRFTCYLNFDKTAVGYRCTYMYKEPAPRSLVESEWNGETIAE